MEKKNSDQLLIIFYKNPLLGKVKTRLAKTVGDAYAFAVYIKLVEHTRLITNSLHVDKVVYYSDFVDTEDNWTNEVYSKALQTGDDLGEKMKNSFEEGFNKGYRSICIIGTDCFELSTNLVEEAFEKLKENGVVIGPAEDGGYYLLGMNSLIPELFENKKWSTDSVCTDTISDLKLQNLTFHCLSILRDVDTEADLPKKFNV